MPDEISDQTLEITHYTVFDDLIADDVTFDIHADTRAVLIGSSVMQDDLVNLYGQLRNRGDLELDGGEFQQMTSFVNVGTVTQSGSADFGASYDDAYSVVVRNAAGATWTVIGANSTGDADSRFVNVGLLDIVAGADDVMSLELIDRGTIDVEGGANIEVARIFGDLIGAGNATFGNAMFDNDNISVESLTDNFGRILGNVTCSSADIYSDAITLAPGATFSITGASVSLILKSISGAGQVEVTGEARIFDTLLANGAEFVNSGVVDAGRAPSHQYLHIDPDSAFLSAIPGSTVSEFRNLAGATWIDHDTTVFYTPVGATGPGLFNAGVLENASEAPTTFAAVVDNEGLITGGPYDNATGLHGGFIFDDALIGQGTVDVGLDAVTFQSSVGSAQTVAFVATPADAGPPHLTLNDVQDFAGTISGFGSADELSVNTSTWSFQGYDASALMFMNGTIETSVKLSGEFDANLFHSSVAGGVTTITYGSAT